MCDVIFGRPLTNKNAYWCNPFCFFQAKSRNVISDIGSGIKSMVGGEIKDMTKLTKDLRSELVFNWIHKNHSKKIGLIFQLKTVTSSYKNCIFDIKFIFFVTGIGGQGASQSNGRKCHHRSSSRNLVRFWRNSRCSSLRNSSLLQSIDSNHFGVKNNTKMLIYQAVMTSKKYCFFSKFIVRIIVS